MVFIKKNRADFELIYKEIEEIGNLFKKNKENLSELQNLELLCLKIVKKIRKIFKSKNIGKNTKNELNKSKSLSSKLLLDIRTRYLELLVEKYGCNIVPSSYIKEHSKELETKLIVEVVNKDGLISQVFQDIIEELIPKHPKDEHTATRSLHRRFIIHCGGTNTGKTYNALQALKNASKGVYLAPLRLLALEVFHTLNCDGVFCTLSTGEEDIVVPFSTHISSTIEKVNLEEDYDVAVIDEAQMISDAQRGNAWTKAILGVKAKEIHICCSKNANNLIIQLIKDCGDEYEVNEYKRNTPLIIDDRHFSFPKNVEKGDALVAFSKKMVLRIAAILSKHGRKVSVLYGNLPPETRRKQMQLFLDGETDIVVTTDVIGMGLNLPIKRVVFMEITKFAGKKSPIEWDFDSKKVNVDVLDGGGRRVLDFSEIKQIAGRAGRKNIFDEGLVNTVYQKDMIKKALDAELKNLTIAYSKPIDEYILSFPIGTLRERLVAWLKSEDSLSYIKKSDISEPLTLLEMIDDIYKNSELSQEDIFKLIFIPFDTKKRELVELWLEYIKNYVNGEPIEMPAYPYAEFLDLLELHYRKLDLYYSFSKTMHLEIDNKNVTNVKSSISNKIHDILKGQIDKMTNKCTRCGKALPWDHPYRICDSCYNSHNRYY